MCYPDAFETPTHNRIDPPLRPPNRETRKPDTRLIVDDPQTQQYLDNYREEFERKNGKPTPHGLWAHQLTLKERRSLTIEELERRIAPWQLDLWAYIMAKSIQAGRIQDLPEFAVACIMDLFNIDATPPAPTPPAPSPRLN